MQLRCPASLRATRSLNTFKTGTAPRIVQSARQTACKAYVEATVTYAVTQQALAYALVLGGDAFVERNSGVAPDIKVVGAGAAATVAAVAIINSGVEALLGVGMVVGVLASGAMLAYHVRRVIDAKDDVDWPGPKALPATVALISFFSLMVFVQGIRAEL